MMAVIIESKGEALLQVYIEIVATGGARLQACIKAALIELAASAAEVSPSSG
jgi:ribonuclease PH